MAAANDERRLVLTVFIDGTSLTTAHVTYTDDAGGSRFWGTANDTPVGTALRKVVEPIIPKLVATCR